MILNAFAVYCSPHNFETWRKKMYFSRVSFLKLYIESTFCMSNTQLYHQIIRKLGKKRRSPLCTQQSKFSTCYATIATFLGDWIVKKPPCLARSRVIVAQDLKPNTLQLNISECVIWGIQIYIKHSAILSVKKHRQNSAGRKFSCWRTPTSWFQADESLISCIKVCKNTHMSWVKNVATHMTFLADLSLGKL